MGSILVFFISAAAFALSSKGLIMALQMNVQVESFVSSYSKRALKVEKAYKVTAWATLTLFLFFTTVSSFWQVFTHL